MHLRSWRSSRPRPSGYLVAAGALVAAAALLPAVYLVVVASQRGVAGAREVVVAPSTRALLGRSIGLATAVTVSSAVIGVGLAWLLARRDVPGRRAWRVLCSMPLALPSYVSAFAYLTTFGPARGFGGAWLVLTSLCYPYVLVPVMATMAGIDPGLEDTARSLGDGRARAFRRVTLPQIRPALASGSLLVALYVVSDFGAVSILDVQTFTTIIYQSYLVGIDPPRGAVLGCVLLVFTLATVTAEARTRGSARYHSPQGSTSRLAPMLPLGRWRWPAAAAPALVTALALGVPLLSMLSELRAAIPAGLDADLAKGALSSLIAASMGAAVTVVAALPVALLAARYRSRLAGAIERSSYVAHALPGVVVALSVAFFAVRFVPALYRRLPVLVFAYLVLFLPLAVAALRARALQIPRALEETARSLGQRPAGVFNTVTGPLLAPGVVAGLVLVFLACLRELPATLLIAPFGFETLATQAWTASERGAGGRAAVPSLLLVMAGAVVTGGLLGRRRSVETDEGESQVIRVS